MLHIIINPATGAGRANRIFKKIKPVFDDAGIGYRVYYSNRNKSIKDIVTHLTGGNEEMSRSGYTDIVLIGGDGSMNEAVNGIEDFSRTRIGLIPAGSGNDLAKALGIGRDVRRTASRIARLKTVRTVDIGLAEVKGRRVLFNISSGLGFDAKTCTQADRSRLKGILNHIGAGKLVYIAVALRLIIKNERFGCRILTDDGRERIYRECLFAVGMNQKYEGGGFMFCPGAADDDGMLDFCAVDGVGALKFLWMFPSALWGKHTKYPEVDVFRAKEAVITTDRPCCIHADGEAGKRQSTVRLSVFDKKLMLLV